MSTSPDGASGGGLIGARQASGVGGAALLSALVSYLTLLAAARSLPAADNAVFLVFWGCSSGPTAS